ncbi:LysR substrate-binding domain-containing protein [Actinacidiphila sp. bgisy167]|uniref:LysR substrate-binding domain-containing protein n=1 Tax=Actinacidiphila sp. bgisy167 TaxID=3413797 RepID=UPI003D745236
MTSPSAVGVPAPPSTPAPFVRLLYQGSPLQASRLVRAAGRCDAEVLAEPHDTGDPLELLRAGRADFAIASAEARLPGLALSPVLFTEGRVLAVGCGHALAGHSAVRLSDLAREGVAPAPAPSPWRWHPGAARTGPGSTRPLRELFRAIVHARTAHVFPASIADVAPRGVRLLDILDAPPLPIALAWSADRGVSPEAAGFLRDVVGRAPADDSRTTHGKDHGR